MTVVRCGHCSVFYSRYRRDHPPSGYCSLLCFESRRRKKIPVPQPGELLSRMRQHRQEVHGSLDLTQWYDCPECERIESQYAESLAGRVA